ncbi:MAG: HEAT repeat domain-containing protein [Candidatus Thorarchaeota archaeon]
MSKNRFIEYVNDDRFDKSYALLSNAIRDGQIDSIADTIESTCQTDSDVAIPIRDHVSMFLDCFPVYFSLDISSAEMLRVVSSAETVIEAQISFFDRFKEMLSNDDSCLVQYKLEIESISTSIYSQLLPCILEKRNLELESCRIPFSVVPVKNKIRTRYSIQELFSTAYGSQLLQVLEIESNNPVIGETKWLELSKSLSALGYEPKSLLIEIDETSWSSHIRKKMNDFTKRSNNTAELQKLQEIYQAYESLSSAGQSKRVSGLDSLRHVYSRVCDIRLFPLARLGTKTERLRALQILIDRKRVDAEYIFLEALQDQDSEIRSRGAIGISSLTSLEFTKISKDIFDEKLSSVKRVVEKTMEGKKSTSFAILQTIASSKNKMARVESIHALVSLSTGDAEQVLFNMLKDPEPFVRLELTKQLKNMSPDFAKVIVNTVLTDESHMVRSAAYKEAEALWPDELWSFKEPIKTE